MRCLRIGAMFGGAWLLRQSGRKLAMNISDYLSMKVLSVMRS
jgi:hypothetical protein